MFDVKSIKKSGYGYSEDTPIRACGVFDSYKYIENLRYETGKILKYERVGSTMSKDGHMIDIYNILVMDYKYPTTVLKYTIYIDMYYSSTDTKKPEDFE